jgi:putative glutamine amidotransferase
MSEMPAESEKPRVGITMRLEGYSQWVLSRGGTYSLLEPGGKLPFDRLSGLLLTGGEDVDPSLYGEVDRKCARVNPARDRFELEVLHRAIQVHLPVLAICRGMQLLVVACGGTLYQDLAEKASSKSDSRSVCHRSPDHHDTVHWVELEPSTIMNRSVSRNSVVVNSHHHQGIRERAAGFSASARSRDGLVEAIEAVETPFKLGVQWHPERWMDPSSDVIMDSFLSACRMSRPGSREHPLQSEDPHGNR